MSITKTIEVVCDLNETRLLRSVLEDSGVECEVKVVLVDGRTANDLNMLVHKDSSVVVMSPVVGG